MRELIAGNHSKTALQLAKDLHKRCATEEAETLLVEAYQARIDDLLKLGMTVEAKSLLAIVRERFPAALTRLANVGLKISALDGRLEEIVSPLCDPNLPAEDRERIESFLRQQIHDLPALAAVSSLPQEHPLRVAASALATAFQAVTEGPVDDEILALPEVSRRSPLASWKALVRAIASYYRREEEECGKWLQTIANDSVPARLLPALATMRGKKSDGKLASAGEKLIRAAGDPSAALHAVVTNLEKALQAEKRGPILNAIRSVAAISGSCQPALRERLHQHIAVRCALQQLPLPSLDAALGNHPRQDAYFYRLLARSLEAQPYADNRAEAAIAWEAFRLEAIKEKWFATGSLEDGVLALHMARLMERVPPDLVEKMNARQTSSRKPARPNEEEGLLTTAALYQRACEADPHPETFQAWRLWAASKGTPQQADQVAEQWRAAHSADIRPLLHLMESAERRGAYKKSLKYLEEAEGLDRLNPEVRRAKLRLLLAEALRHLRQRKAHLARGGIKQLAAIPGVRPGEIASLTAALRWCAAVVDGDKAVQQECEAEVHTLLGSVGASLLTAALAKKADIATRALLPLLKPAEVPALELLNGAAKAHVLAEWAGLPIKLPSDWEGPLIAALNRPNCSIEAAQMLALGEAAMESLSAELAYAVSAAGLAKGGADAEFLFLRARSLRSWAAIRRDGCFTAALELARRERNTELAGKILDYLNGKQPDGDLRWMFGFSETDDPEIASRPVSAELLTKILEEERELKQFPASDTYRDPNYASAFEDPCDCIDCRAKRGEVLDGELDNDDFDDPDFDDEDIFDGLEPAVLKNMTKMLEEFLASMPPEMAQQAKKAIAAGQDPVKAIDKVMKKAFPKPESTAPSGKGTSAPASPDQHRLF